MYICESVTYKSQLDRKQKDVYKMQWHNVNVYELCHYLLLGSVRHIVFNLKIRFCAILQA
jgi:hypothetical protein